MKGPLRKFPLEEGIKSACLLKLQSNWRTQNYFILERQKCTVGDEVTCSVLGLRITEMVADAQRLGRPRWAQRPELAVSRGVLSLDLNAGWSRSETLKYSELLHTHDPPLSCAQETCPLCRGTVHLSELSASRAQRHDHLEPTGFAQCLRGCPGEKGDA